MLFIFGRNALGRQRWDEIAGAVTGEAFFYFQTLILVLDVSDVQNCRQEDDLAFWYNPSIPGSAPFENNNNIT